MTQWVTKEYNKIIRKSLATAYSIIKTFYRKVSVIYIENFINKLQFLLAIINYHFLKRVCSQTSATTCTAIRLYPSICKYYKPSYTTLLDPIYFNTLRAHSYYIAHPLQAKLSPLSDIIRQIHPAIMPAFVWKMLITLNCIFIKCLTSSIEQSSSYWKFLTFFSRTAGCFRFKWYNNSEAVIFS